MLRIRDWSTTFENNRSRQIDSLSWVAVPNGFDGIGYAQTMMEPDGVALLGAWDILIRVASSLPRASRDGRLARTSGKPHDAVSISLMTRAPISPIERAIEFFQSIGWLELVTSESDGRHDGVTTASVGSQSIGTELKGIGLKGIEGEVEKYPGPSGPASSPDHQTETTKKTQTALEQESAQAWNDVIASVEGCALARVRSKDGVAQFPNSLSKHLRVIRKSGNYDTDEEMIDDLKDRALRLAHDPFCNGQNDRRWVASLNYLMSPSGWDKALGRVLPGQVPTTNGHQSAPRTGEGIMARKCRELREAREAREREEASRVGSR